MQQNRDQIDAARIQLSGSCWGAFQQWRKRDRLRTELYGLNDRELMDIGITRGEIDYVASNRGIDPRGIRPAEWSSVIWQR